MTHSQPYLGKRAFDLLGVVVLALPAALLGAVCAMAVAVSSRGPVLFRQERVGRDDEAFNLLKFRTMIHDVAGNRVHPDPHRITRIGAVLRRLSLDELPQLVNVLRGEMSLVGPRPTLRYQVERYDDRQRGRLAVRPGLTGLAQVQGRNTLTWGKRIDLDLEYVQGQSVWLDLKLLVRTARVVLSGSGTGGHPVDDPIAAEVPMSRERP